MYHVSAQCVDKRMINANYYYCYYYSEQKGALRCAKKNMTKEEMGRLMKR